MWQFFKNFFKQSQSLPPVKIEENQQKVIVNTVTQSVVQNTQSSSDIDDYTYRFNGKELTDFENSLLKLKSYDGYTRQKMLKKLQQCFEPELFPHLLYRLSDYVEVNRHLAAEHILRWSKRPEFSKLCSDYFFEISMLQNRDRTDSDSLKLLLSEVSSNRVYLSETLINKQGKLPRILLKFILQYQWIEEYELLQFCGLAKDQHIRAFWLKQLIQHKTDEEVLYQLKQSSYRDVQYRLFDFLYQKDVLTTDDLILFWHSKFLTIMDYAYFALRSKNFNFEMYFKAHPVEQLSTFDVRIRAHQWMLLKGDLTEFYTIIEQVNQPLIVDSILSLALKQKYIEIDQYFSFYRKMGRKLHFYHLSKAKKYLSEKPSLDELIHYSSFIDDGISFHQRLELVNGSNFADQLYWYVKQHDYIETIEDQQLLGSYVRQNLQNLKYAIYGVQWTESQKIEMRNRLPDFTQLYPDIFDDQNIRVLLRPYLE